MTCKAEKGKDSLVGITFAEAVQFFDHIVAVFGLGFHQGQELFRCKTESGNQFLEVSVVS